MKLFCIYAVFCPTATLYSFPLLQGIFCFELEGGKNMSRNLFEQAISGAYVFFFISASALSIFLPCIGHLVFSDLEQFYDKHRFPFNLYYEDYFVVGDAFQIVSFLSPNHIAERWQQ
jgi:hypothetical protein